MSYILEALKKSEQQRERERGNLPDIKSVHTPSAPPADTRRWSWWPFLLLAVLLINGAIFAVVYLGDDADGSARATSGNEVAAADHQSNIPQSTPARSSARQPVAALKSSDQSSLDSGAGKSGHTEPLATAEDTATGTSRPAAKSRVIFSKEPLQRDDTLGNAAELYKEEQKHKTKVKATVKKEAALLPSELPEQIRKQLPKIAFEGHVYSSSVARRSVMINGKKMREGESVGPGLLVKEITPLGAEFEYQGYRFKLNALQDWSYQ